VNFNLKKQKVNRKNMKKTIYLFGLILSIVYSSNIYSQCVTGDCNNGEGTYLYTNAKYWGNWKDGKRNGYGVFTYNDGTSMYKGNWLNDKKHGFGNYFWNDGDQYEGYYIEDKMNGQGTYTYANGDRFIGQFLDHKRTENGVYTAKAIKKGCVSGDCNNGYGKYVYSNAIYEGYFKNGKKEGRGKMIFWDNGSYEGDNSNDLRNGKGKFTYIDGSYYDGDWVNGERTGKGIFIWGKGKWEGDSFEGDFISGSRTGYGKYIEKDGTIQEGKWLNNVFQEVELASNNSKINSQNSNTAVNSSTKNTVNTVSNYKFTKAPELKINYIDNRKMCCCCDQTFSQYKLKENVIIEEKIRYLTEKLAIFHQQNGNALLSETRNETQIKNDLDNLKAFLNVTYPGNELFIMFIDMYHLSFMSGIMIFNKTKPGSTERFVEKYEIISPFCSLRCKNDVRCQSCH
jgi:hypothetical protein